MMRRHAIRIMDIGVDEYQPMQNDYRQTAGHYDSF
jgi:hypothetical protein